MNVQILSNDKHDMEVMVDNPTTIELLRQYLNAEGIDFAAWRRDHPSKPLLFKVKSSSKTVVKAIEEAASAIKKDCDKILSVLKK